LISEDEARQTVELDDMFVIQPAHPWWQTENWNDGRTLPDGFRYSSDANPEKLSTDQLSAMIRETESKA
jgi:UDP-N-acetylglucosamine 4,6-dehydratase